MYNAFQFQSRLQVQAGCWGTDLSCVLTVTPMLIIAWYITAAKVPEAHAIELANHLFAAQDQRNGGWPTYLGAKATLMGTILVYVALRLMGFSEDHKQLVAARNFLLQMGGAVVLPCWAKFWLCLLGLYDWEGTDPYPVEMWCVVCLTIL